MILVFSIKVSKTGMLKTSLAINSEHGTLSLDATDGCFVRVKDNEQQKEFLIYQDVCTYHDPIPNSILSLADLYPLGTMGDKIFQNFQSLAYI